MAIDPLDELLNVNTGNEPIDPLAELLTPTPTTPTPSFTQPKPTQQFTPQPAFDPLAELLDTPQVDPLAELLQPQKLPVGQRITNFIKQKAVQYGFAIKSKQVAPSNPASVAKWLLKNTNSGKSLQEGGFRVAEGMTKIPAFAWDMAVLPTQKMLKDAKTASDDPAQKVALEYVSRKLRSPEWLRNNPAAKYLADKANSVSYLQKEFKGESLVSIAKKDPIRASEYLYHQIVSNLPQQIAIIGSAIAGMPAVGLGLMGLTSGAQRSAQNIEQGIDPVTSTTNATIIGALEVATERLGSSRLAQKFVKQIAKTSGKEAARGLFATTIKRIFAQAGGEGLEEFSNSIAGDITDKAMGVNPNALEGMFGRALEAGAIGAGSGFAVSTPAAVAGGVAQKETQAPTPVDPIADLVIQKGTPQFLSKQATLAKTAGITTQDMKSLSKEKTAVLGDVTTDSSLTEDEKIISMQRLVGKPISKEVKRRVQQEKDRQFAQYTLDRKIKLDSQIPQILDTINRGKTADILAETDRQRFNSEQSKNKLQRGLAKVGNHFRTYLTAESITRVLDGNQVGLLTQHAVINQRDSQAKEYLLMENDRKVMSKFNQDLDFAELTRREHNVGNETNLSVDDIMDQYLNSKNAHGLMVLENSGISKTQIAAIHEFMNKPENTKHKTYADSMLKYLSSRWSMLRDVYKKMTGKELPQIDNYYPVMFLDSNDAMEATQLELAQKAEFYDPAADTSAIKKRIENHKVGFREFSMSKKVMKHLTDTNHYIAYAESIDDANKIFKNPSVRRSIARRKGEGVNRYLDDYFQDLARGKFDKNVKPWEQLMGKIRQYSYPVILGFRISSALKTWGSLSPVVPMVGLHNMTAATAEFMTNPLKAMKFVENLSSAARNRGFAIDPNLREFKADKDIQQYLTGKKGANRIIAETSMLMLMANDKVVVTLSGLAAYYKMIEEGRSDNKKLVAEFVDDVIGRTQPTGNLVDAAEIFRTSESARVMHMFTNYLNKVINLEYTEFNKLIDPSGGSKVKRSLQYANFQFWTVVIPALIMGKIGDLFYPDKEKRDTIGKFAAHYGMLFASQVLGAFPFLGAMAKGPWGLKTVLESLKYEINQVGKKKTLKGNIWQTTKLGLLATGRVPMQLIQWAEKYSQPRSKRRKRR